VYSRFYATTPRWADIPGLFLGNGSVNTFPLLGSRFLITQQLDYNNRRAVFYVVRAEMFITKRQGQFSQFCMGVCEERT
jgi:hypothetical protein